MTQRAKKSVESLGQIVQEVISAFVPRSIDSERWEVIADFVRDAVRDLDVPEHIGRGYLGSYLLIISQLAAWVSIHYPLERERIFDPKVIKAFHSRQQAHLAPATASNRMRFFWLRSVGASIRGGTDQQSSGRSWFAPLIRTRRLRFALFSTGLGLRGPRRDGARLRRRWVR